MADIVVNPANLGLGNVDNTFDLDKPISTATQMALNEKADTTYVDNKTRNVDVIQYGFFGDGRDEEALLTTLLSTVSSDTTIVIPRGTIIGTSGEHVLPAGVNISGGGEIRKLNRNTAKHHGLKVLGNNVIERITFNGNALNLTNADITQHTELSVAGPNVTVRDCRFVESSGTFISGKTSVDGFWAHGCTFDEWDDHAIYFSTDAKNIFVENNVMESSAGRTALKLRDCQGHAFYQGNEISCFNRPIELVIQENSSSNIKNVAFANNVVRTDTAGVLCKVIATNGAMIEGLSITGNMFSQRNASTDVDDAVNLAWDGKTTAKNVIVRGNIFEDVIKMPFTGGSTHTLENVELHSNIFRIKNAVAAYTDHVTLGNCENVSIKDNIWDVAGTNSGNSNAMYITDNAKATIQGNTFKIHKQYLMRLTNASGLELTVQDNLVEGIGIRLTREANLGAGSLLTIIGNVVDKAGSFFANGEPSDSSVIAIGQNIVDGVVV